MSHSRAIERLAGVYRPTRLEHEGEHSRVVAHVEPGPTRSAGELGEDSALVFELDDGIVLAVADGMGGASGGGEASELAVDTLAKALHTASSTCREAVMDAFERTDTAARSSATIGCTTLLVCVIQRGSLRTYNAGDSHAVLIGGRGKVKLRTIMHSPVGLQVAAGLLDENEALHHDERHYVSNVVGSGAMHIDVGPSVELAPRDTLVIGSDGLFDNLTIEEIASYAHQRSLSKVADELVSAVRHRMNEPTPGEPSKPDDFSFVLHRFGATGPR